MNGHSLLLPLSCQGHHTSPRWGSYVSRGFFDMPSNDKQPKFTWHMPQSKNACCLLSNALLPHDDKSTVALTGHSVEQRKFSRRFHGKGLSYLSEMLWCLSPKIGWKTRRTTHFLIYIIYYMHLQSFTKNNCSHIPQIYIRDIKRWYLCTCLFQLWNVPSYCGALTGHGV